LVEIVCAYTFLKVTCSELKQEPSRYTIVVLQITTNVTFLRTIRG